MYILVIALIAGNVQALVTIDADDPNIQYSGRTNYDDPKAPIMRWPGSYIIANFEGTSINVKLQNYGDNYFYVIIDDGAPSLIILTPGHSVTYTAATGLTDAVHKIQLFKRTEGKEGEVAFKGFELDDGKSLVAPPARPSRRIEYYGDSITSGHSVASTTGDTDEGWGKDNYYTYAAVTARNLNAEYHCIALSGVGLYVDKWWYGGNMFNYYDRELNTTTWDFSRWTPHIVVINLGQNDYWGNYSQAGAEQAYVDLAQILRGHYPDAHIILALGSMNATAPASPWPTYLQNAVDELNTTYGDAKVYSLIFPYSGNPHPTIARHADMADQLTAFIQTSIPDPWLSNGDINSDGDVDFEDFALFGLWWLDTGCGSCGGADLTGEGDVTIDDLNIMANNWLVDL
ncbi:MAG: GDSL-type esterase/lipase family protein [Planctomycetota bacterium]